MKNKNYFNWKNILIIDLVLIAAAFFMLRPFSHSFVDLAFAQEATLSSGTEGTEGDGYSAGLEGYPYTGTFKISAYYSPLPCQNRYVTGSYAGDIRLNGGGVRGADGSPVYAGMVAAPRTYAFGTKMDIPGVGIVAVHDRGGAIVSGNGVNLHDRLDVWMGYGDKGLTRALQWGKRTMEVVVYGVDESIVEQVTLGDYSPDESSCGSAVAETAAGELSPGADAAVSAEPDNGAVSVGGSDVTGQLDPFGGSSSELIKVEIEPRPVVVAAESGALLNPVQPQLEELIVVDLKLGDTGDRVRSLQNQLKKLNFYRTEVTGNFGEVTKHAVFKFQQSQKLVMDENSPYAGVFGPKTRDRINELVASNNYNQVRIAQASNDFQAVYLAQIEADRPRRSLLSMELRYGMRGPEVAELQKFLKAQGFFDGVLITQYYGDVTKDAVLNFQKAHHIVGSVNETGAGHVGPATLEVINTLS